MNSNIIGGLAVLAILAIIIPVVRQLDKRQKAKKKREFEDNTVGPEVLQLEAGGIISAFPIQLFNDRDVVSLTVNQVVDSLVTQVHAACKKASLQKKALRLVVNSTGGDVIVARTINGLLRHFIEGGHEVWIVVEGKCYSAGITILMAVATEYRLAVRGSEFMIHASRTTSGNRQTARTYALDAEEADIVSAGSLIERSSLTNLFRSGKDCIFPVDDALKMNIIGGVI